MARHRELVAVSLIGGLGNQLFQFAAAKSLVPGRPAVVDDRLCRFWGNPLADALKAGAHRPIGQRELMALRQVPRVGRGQRTLMRHDSSSRCFHEAAEIGYDERIETAPRPVLLKGYFHSERYFAEHRDLIAESIRQPDTTARQREIEMIARGRPTVALSLRTGSDYEAFGSVLDREYQLAAAQHLVSSLGDATFVIFGDVLADCAHFAKMLDAPAVVCANEPPLKQLSLLGRQQHAIIANSSFAWWGAWLGDQAHRDPERIVLRPDPWLRTAGDPCPDRWVKIPARFA